MERGVEGQQEFGAPGRAPAFATGGRAGLPRLPSPEEIEAARTPRGGWTRAQLAAWGVPWPAPKGWKQRLEQEWRAADGSTSAPSAGSVAPQARSFSVQEALPGAFGDASAAERSQAAGLDERRGRCPDCAMEVLKYQVPTGKWILVDPEPITHSVRPHLPPDALWIISEGVAVRPDQHGDGPRWVWHHRTCRALNPAAASLLQLWRAPARSMEPTAPVVPELMPMRVVPVRPELDRADVVEKVACSECGAVRGSPCTTPRGRAKKSLHRDRWVAYRW
ncbi:DUF6083 domain-containing protein [Streptomyces filamentosus]